MFQALFNDEKNSQTQFWENMTQNNNNNMNNNNMSNIINSNKDNSFNYENEIWQYFISKSNSFENLNNNENNAQTTSNDNKTNDENTFGSVDTMTKYVPILLKTYFNVLLNEGSENVLRSIVPVLFQRLNMVFILKLFLYSNQLTILFSFTC